MRPGSSIHYTVLPLMQSLGKDGQTPSYWLCITSRSNSENETVRENGENSPFQQNNKDRNINFSWLGIVAEPVIQAIGRSKLKDCFSPGSPGEFICDHILEQFWKKNPVREEDKDTNFSWLGIVSYLVIQAIGILKFEDCLSLRSSGDVEWDWISV